MTNNNHSFYNTNSISKRFPCALLLETNTITKPVKIALITQRKGKIEALQSQFYAFYLTDKLFYTVSKVKKNFFFPHLIILRKNFTQIMI